MAIHTEQQSTWQKLQGVVSSSELSARCVVAFTVRDPRILLPQKRTKIMADPEKVKAHPTSGASSGCSFNCTSPLWNADIRKTVKSTQMSQHRLNQVRTKLLVPGTEINLSRQESRIPVLLLHNPGVKGQPGNRQGMMGFGAGWDVVLPAGWAMGFWIALMYRGARVGGLRESRSCALQQGLPHFPDDAIDTEAGRTHAVMVRKELEKTQSRKPPAKRSNYAKLGVPTPFHIEWRKLLTDWKGETGQEGDGQVVSGQVREGQVASTDTSLVEVMRDKQKLHSLEHALNDIKKVSKNVKGRQELMERYKAEVITVSSVPAKSRKRSAPDPDDSHAVSQKKKFKSGDAEDTRGQGESEQQVSAGNSATVPSVGEPSSDETGADLFTDSPLADMYVCVQLSLINKGAPGPHSLICLPSSADLEALANSSQYGGPMEPVHKEYALPRKPKNKTKSVDDENGNKKITGKITTDKLGVPNLEGVNLVKFCARKVIGYLTNGVHALSTGRGFGVGYCCMAGLRELVRGKPKDREAVVLVRDTGSLQYRFAKVKVQM